MTDPINPAHYTRLKPEPSPNCPESQPQPSEHPAVWDLVMADMRERDAIGTAKYGVRLKAFDGRDSLVDSYQEALDLAVYLRKAIYERGIGMAEAQQKQIAALRNGITEFLEVGVDRPGIKHKGDKCPHGLFGWDACDGCITEHFQRVMASADVLNYPPQCHVGAVEK